MERVWVVHHTMSFYHRISKDVVKSLTGWALAGSVLFYNGWFRIGLDFLRFRLNQPDGIVINWEVL